MTTEILKDYIIYKLYCKNKEIIDEYYGHTCAFRARKCHHKASCNNENDRDYNTDKYKFIREKGGWDNWIMSPIEELKNCSLINAQIREQFHIDLNKSTMNKNKAYITEEQRLDYQKEYFLENRDTLLEKQKEYYLENRDKIVEQKKQYCLENRDKILEQKKQYRLENRDTILEKQKEKYLENRDTILEKQKEYRLENRDKILEKKKEKITCICGKIIRKDVKLRHEQTKFHCKFIQSAM